ncbi:STAS domain-containing protein [uncultured Albimonas sp.]|uniref:STAS domain-containing protein n=1 Tax=uncultured Albimonas sp. TaxID=1331701 RepID=UPI0030EEDEEA
MTATRTSRGKTAPADASEAEMVDVADLDEAPPPVPSQEEPLAEAAAADDLEGEELDAADPEAVDPVGGDAEDASPDVAAPDLQEAEDELSAAEAEADDADPAPDAADPGDPAAETPASGEPFRLHRRARHDETQELLTWLRAAPAGSPLTLDASEVDNLSTPYVLAIVAAARTRADAGSPAVVTSPSPAFVDAFSDLGLFGDLMKMEIRA